MRLARNDVMRGFPIFGALVASALAFTACGGSGGPGVASLGRHHGHGSTGEHPSGSASGLQTSGQGGKSASQGIRRQQTDIAMSGVTLEYSRCMQSHGVPNFPDPNGEGQVSFSFDPNSTPFNNAQKACAKYSPGGGKPPTPAQQEKALANALKFSRCMRAHGIKDFPDPTTGPDGAIGFQLKDGIRPNSALMRSAQRACQSILRSRTLR